MHQFFELVKRNLRLYLRDRGAVFFSLLTMLIVIALMVFFLGEMNIEAVTDMLGALPDRDAEKDRSNAELLVLVWTCAGIIPINAVTVTLSALSSMIKDKTTGRINSIYTSPVSRFVISSGYAAAAWLSSVIICAATLAITEIYCVIKGAEPFSVTAHIKLLGMIAANSFTYSAIMYLLAAAAKTEGAWSGLGTVIGTLVGFLGGIYLPIGSVSDGIAAAMKCTPVLYGTSMFRKIMTEQILDITLDGAPQEMYDGYAEAMGITLTVFDHEVSPAMCVSVLILCGAVFLVLGALYTEFGRKKDR